MTLKNLLFIFPFATVLMACGGAEEETSEENTEETADTTAVEETTEEESTLAFDGVDKDGFKLYGHTEIEPTEAFTKDEMFIEYETAGAFNDKVAVNIENVCQKAGCWITFKGKEDEEIRVVFRDHFTIPIETATGTEAVLYGSLMSDTISIDMQKHYLDDAQEAGEEVTQAEYDAITEDKIELSFDCESILVKQG